MSSAVFVLVISIMTITYDYVRILIIENEVESKNRHIFVKPSHWTNVIILFVEFPGIFDSSVMTRIISRFFFSRPVKRMICVPIIYNVLITGKFSISLIKKFN